MSNIEQCRVWINSSDEIMDTDVVTYDDQDNSNALLDIYYIPKAIGACIESTLYKDDGSYRWKIISDNIILDTDSHDEIRSNNLDNNVCIDIFLNNIHKFNKEHNRYVAEVEPESKKVEEPFDRERYDKAAKEIFEEFKRIKL
jgi:hypothetical protein